MEEKIEEEPKKDKLNKDKTVVEKHKFKNI
jgi:hypothetical protein